MDLYDVTHRAIWATLDGMPAEALHRANADGWSILHVLEHIELFERRTAVAIAEAMAAPPTAEVDPARDLSFALVRTVRLRAPEPIRPQGRFAGLADAQEALRASGDAVSHTFAAAAVAGDVDRHGSRHGAFGMLSARQWYDVAVLHVIRHLHQIHEMR